MSPNFSDEWRDVAGGMVELLTLLHQDLIDGTRTSAQRIEELAPDDLRALTCTMLGALFGYVAAGAAHEQVTIESALQTIGLQVHTLADRGEQP